jgi:hypothetical protein
MLKKLSLAFFCVMFCLSMVPVLTHAKDFVVESYDFTWNVAKAGDVVLEVKRDQDRIGVSLRNTMGRRLTTLFMSASEARAIGQILMKAEEYCKQAQDSKPRAPKVVMAGDYRVTFTLVFTNNFDIEVERHKMFSPSVRMSKGQALQIGKYMLEAKEMVAFLERRMKL